MVAKLENAAPTSALPLGSTRVLSPTRLSRVDPSGPAHVVRLLNTVLAIVAITPEDRLGKAQEVKKEGSAEIVKAEGEDAEDGQEEGQEPGEEEDEDEVPYREEIVWREVLGFIVMCVLHPQIGSHYADRRIALQYRHRRATEEIYRTVAEPGQTPFDRRHRRGDRVGRLGIMRPYIPRSTRLCMQDVHDVCPRYTSAFPLASSCFSPIDRLALSSSEANTHASGTLA